jgi:hypothetical protein
MKIMPKIAAVAVTVLALGGAGATTAMAASHGSASPRLAASSDPSRPDHGQSRSHDRSSRDGKSRGETRYAVADRSRGHRDGSKMEQYKYSEIH